MARVAIPCRPTGTLTLADWNPALYSRFEDERTRPARELLMRVPLSDAAQVADLGCGPGNSTELLADCFPRAEIVGIDNSRAMLEAARKRLPGVRFEFDDALDWEPDTAPDLLYANASLQWVPHHEHLIPRLFDLLAPGGVLAIQMPDNRNEPTHRLMHELASEPAYAGHIGDASRLRTDLLSIQRYYDLLAARASEVDVWHTVYQHPMANPAAIVDWLRATGLKPFVDPLPPELQARFLAEYEHRLDLAYPVRGDGRRLLAFPRMFIVARKS